MPFEVPEGWVWTTLPELCTIPITDGTHQTPTYTDKEHGIPFISSKDVTSRKIDWGNVKYITQELHEELYKRISPQKGDILLAKNGTTGVAAIVEDSRVFDIYVTLAVIRPSQNINPQYLLQVINSSFCKEQFNSHLTGIGLPNLHLVDIKKTVIPVPPFAEQYRISKEIERYFALVDALEQNDYDLKDAIQKTKAKILDLALSGKFTSDTSHYPQLPDGWEYKQLDEVLDYEQPQKYIVESTDYSDDYTTPVLTAGKSFIIGHTNERSGICTDVPVIIFDDFTTDSKFVDFPFKVKSSAMKILHPKGDINLKYLAYFMSNTRLVGTTHKRYWISEYSKIKVPIPPKEEQDKIVFLIEEFYSLMDSIFVDQS